MKEEINSIKKNDTWELVELSKGKKCVGSKWVYKTKYNSDDDIERFKARIMDKELTQIYRIYYK